MPTHTPTVAIWHPDKPDSRSMQYPLIGEFWPTGLITLIYVVGCYYWRKHLIEKRAKNTPNADKNALLQNIIVLYNFVMVLYSSCIVIGITYSILFENLNLVRCGKYDRSSHPYTLRVMTYGYAFYISKFIELLDTLFFLLRGKVDQITFLHVFHHAAMPPSLWWGMRYSPGGVLIIFPLINSFIHVLMYTYYGLAALGAYKYLWWKEYLTQAQMLQFAIMIVHQSQVFWPGSKCEDPKAFPAAIMAYSALFLVLFGNFYVKAYMKKQRLAKKEADFKSTVRQSQVSNGIATTTKKQQ
ncbi:Elongation of very long chain fatty acids protein 7 [Cichlidogyrus casuarinus]|uniref:Elongation of very long chain fatty acids protein n=1 Tax=Cichlidogyrus casuarinus TaxID=1844966 RepID=A0ABD2QB21_9PLAT